MARSTHLHREVDDADIPLHHMRRERGSSSEQEPTGLWFYYGYSTITAPYHVR
jgi:hypothetical protein